MLLNKDTLVKVTNRSDGSLSYNIPDLNLIRRFAYGETKELTVDELRKLSYIPGGQYLLDNDLYIENEDLVRELLGEVEPEYSYSEADVRNLLVNGLDFAPDGVKDLVKKVAVETELNDVRKREAIMKQLNFDVTKAIEIKKDTETVDDENAETVGTRRVKASVLQDESQGGNSRRTQPPKYKVVK